ncbi:MAG: translation initiation factor IF-1 [Patescibacteria group bacterium]|nr:translation initiation factor IF-1 [Patescibacteria group bacterium]
MTENKSQNQNQAEGKKTLNSKDFIELQGEVLELMPDTTFKVLLENGHEIFAYLAGRMRMNKIRLLPGDKVRVQISPYDLTKGRVVYRL